MPWHAFPNATIGLHYKFIPSFIDYGSRSGGPGRGRGSGVLTRCGRSRLGPAVHGIRVRDLLQILPSVVRLRLPPGQFGWPELIEASYGAAGELGVSDHRMGHRGRCADARPPPGLRARPRKGTGGFGIRSRRQGEPQIEALVFDGPDREHRLVEIDENLMRADLTPLDRSRFLVARKKIHLELHPDRRRGGDRKSRDRIDRLRSYPDPQPSWAAETAERISLSPRTIQRAVTIGPVHAGRIPGGPSYGYRIAHRVDGEGRLVRRNSAAAHTPLSNGSGRRSQPSPRRPGPAKASQLFNAASDRLRRLDRDLDPESWPRGVRAHLWRPPEPPR